MNVMNGQLSIHRMVVTAALFLSASSAVAKPAAEVAFDEWLAAFNSNDRAQIRAFNERRFGDADHNLDYLLDSREETGGLDVIKLERTEPMVLVAMTRERNFAAYRRVTVTLDQAGGTKLKDVRQDPQRMSQDDALRALDAFATHLADTDRFSGVLVIEKNGNRLYAKAFGLADRENDIPVRLDTPFLFASQGKMFTAVAVLQLVHAGKLGLDDPLGKYLTGYPNKEMAKVTIRQLLSHQGGTGDIGVLQPEEGGNRAWVRTIDDVIKLNGNRAPSFPPGSAFEYSNYGFVLLGAVLEKISGQSYYAYLDEHVFGPAGMTATRYPDLEHMSGIARGYTRQPDDKLIPSADQLPWRGTPAGGGVTTVDDEVRFVEALKAGKLIPLQLLSEAIKQQTDWYGYGFISSGPEAFPHWGHGGGAAGNSAALSVYPTNNMTMACLSNRDPPVCDRLLINLHWHLSPSPAPGGLSGTGGSQRHENQLPATRRSYRRRLLHGAPGGHDGSGAWPPAGGLFYSYLFTDKPDVKSGYTPFTDDPGWISPMRFTAAASSLVVLLSMAPVAPVSAAQPDIFGITLGAPLALPLCQISVPAPAAPRSNKGIGARAFNKLMTPPPEPPKATPPATGLCVAPGATNMAVGNTEFAAGEYGYLVFATDEFPAWVAPIGMAIGAGADDAFSLEGAGGLVLLRNGRVIALRFNTTGFEAQPRVMELLKRKFGSPSAEKAVTWNNALGGNRESISAQWRKPDFFVDYSSVVQSQPMRAQGLSGGIGFLSIGNDLGQQVLQPAASKEAEF